MDKKMMGMVVGIVIAFGVGFGSGMAYSQKSSAPGPTNAANQARAGQFGGGSGRGAGFARGGANVAVGDVLAKDDKSLTVKTRDGSSKIVFIDSNTQILHTTTGTIEDVGVGSSVMAMGTAGSDGTITAQSIQIRPVSSTQR
jgi:hypothetical protein